MDAGVFLVACIVLVAFRLHAFAVPLETDECNYAYIAGRLLAGDQLYSQVWDHQPPGVFVLFAGIIALLGDTPEVFRWVATIFSLGTLGILFLLLRRLASLQAAWLGVALFALVSSDPNTAGEGCNREIYMNTLILAGAFCVFRSVGRDHLWTFLGGCAFALASVIKTVAAGPWLLLAMWLATAAWKARSSDRRVRHVIATITFFSLAPLLFWIGLLGYFWSTNRADIFLDAVFGFNLSYAGGSSFPLRAMQFFSPPRHPFVFDSAFPLWIVSAGGVVALGYRTVVHRSVNSAGALCLIGGCLAAVCLPGRYWPHYYYLLVPPAVIASVMAIDWAVECTKNWSIHRVSKVALYGLLPLTVLFTEYNDYLSQPAFGITASRYNSRDFWGRAMGEKIRSVTDPGDSIFVYGNEAEIYYYAQRRCASRFTMITGMHEGLDGAVRRRQQLMSDLKRDRPRVVIVLYDQDAFGEWARFLEEHYGTAVGWDCHDKYSATCANPDPSQVTMLVFVDQERPIDPIEWSWDRSEVGGWLPGAHR